MTSMISYVRCISYELAAGVAQHFMSFFRDREEHARRYESFIKRRQLVRKWRAESLVSGHLEKAY